LAQIEACDGKDNDCDGVIDNDQSFLGAPLGSACVGFGACGNGIVECSPETGVAICSTNPGGSEAEDTTEICDGVDNDCNGFVDDGLGISADGFSSCSTPGVCGMGTFVCSETGDVVCSTAPGEIDSPAAEEVCNGLDDDCDGLTDEATLGDFADEWELIWSLNSQPPELIRASGGGKHVFMALASSEETQGAQIAAVNLDEGTTEFIALPQETKGLPAGLIWEPMRNQLFLVENGLQGVWGGVHVLDAGGIAWADWGTASPSLSAVSCTVLLNAGILMLAPEGAWLLDLDEREWSSVTLPDTINPSDTMSCEGGIISNELTLRQRAENSDSSILRCGLEGDPTFIACGESIKVEDSEQGWFDGNTDQTVLVKTDAGRVFDWNSNEEYTFPQKPFSTMVLESWWDATRSVGHLLTWSEGAINLFTMERTCPAQ